MKLQACAAFQGEILSSEIAIYFDSVTHCNFSSHWRVI